MPSLDQILDHFAGPLRLDYMSAPAALGLFLALAAPVVWTGLRSLKWLSPTRQAVAIGVRLAVIWVLVMIIAGARWQRQHRDVEVMVLRDVSASIANVPPPPGTTIESAIDQFLRSAVATTKPPADRIGSVRFAEQALVQSLPQEHLRLDLGAMQQEIDGTDIAAAIQIGLACFSGEAMKRLVLISDGNATDGQTHEALAAAGAARVPVDVLPLEYRLTREVMLERMTVPTMVRQGEAFAIELVLRSTHAEAVSGKLTITHQGLPMDMDPDAPQVQSALDVALQPGLNAVRLKAPPLWAGGLHEFRAVFQPDVPTVDRLAANNAAVAFAFVRAPGRILYVDNVPDDEGVHLSRALAAEGISAALVDRIVPEQFPSRAIELQGYDAVILANVPRGATGLNDQQDRALARYVHDTGGGLVVIGGPEALGAGNWQGSELEKVLPVNLDVPAQRVLRAGALMLVLDHSGSMGGPMPKDPAVIKQQVANESAVLAMRTLLPGDWLGVIAFDVSPTWVVRLARHRDPQWAADRIRSVGPAGGTSIGPALEEAVAAMSRIGPEQAAVKLILLLTDGISQPYDYDALLAKLRRAKITLSTVAVGGDADRALLADLAARGGGSTFVVDDPYQLMQVFVRQARTLRRPLIHEPPGGLSIMQEPGAAIELLKTLSGTQLPPLVGMVLCSRRPDPTAQVLLSAANSHRDPILAHWQTGLGRSAVFTGDATRRWAPSWIGSPLMASFWTQVVRGVARPAISSDFDIATVRDNKHTLVIVEAFDQSGRARSFCTFTGRLVGADGRSGGDLRFVQTAPGRYEASLDTPDPGNHVAVVQYSGADGQRGTLVAGTTHSASPEMRDLQSNDLLLREIASATAGRILPGLDPLAANVFTREGLARSASHLPVWDILLSVVMGMVIIDVAVRRIAWDWNRTKQLATAAAVFVRSFTATRKVETRQTLDALRRVREEAAEAAKPPAVLPEEALPDRTARFEAEGVEGDITEVVGGATDKLVPTPPSKTEPEKPLQPGAHTSSLLEAKRRAQQQIRQKEQGQ